MPRALWSGSLSFGLVNVPVQLFSAVRDVDVHFTQLHGEDGSPIDVRRFCKEEDKEVAYEDLGHGYDLDDGKQVVLTDDELATVEPRKTRTIDIEAFVDLADIDPVFFDHPYFLLPSGESEGPRRAYRLLVEVMGRSDRVALGRFVLRTKEYLVAIRVRDGRLALTTMLFGDELRPTDGIETGGRKPRKAEVEQAVALIERLSVEWDPGRYEDRYRKRLLEVIDRKKRGKRIKVERDEDEEPGAVPDLMEALRRSLEEAKAGGTDGGEDAATDGGDGRKGGGKGGGKDDGGDGGDLAGLSRDELYERAKDAGVPGRSGMTKDELIDALSG